MAQNRHTRVVIAKLRGRHYYVNQTTQKVTWKHPTVTNQRAKFGQAAGLE